MMTEPFFWLLIVELLIVLPLFAWAYMEAGDRIESFRLMKAALEMSKQDTPKEEKSVEEALEENILNTDPLLQVYYPEPARPSIPPRPALPISSSPSLPALKRVKAHLQAEGLPLALPRTSGEPVSFPVTPSPASAQAVPEEPPRLYMREPVSFLVALPPPPGARSLGAPDVARRAVLAPPAVGFPPSPSAVPSHDILASILKALERIHAIRNQEKGQSRNGGAE